MLRNQRIFNLVILAVAAICLSSVIMVFTVKYSADDPRMTLHGKDILQSIEDEYQMLPKPKTMLVILTYMRSGSTFTGDIIQRSPDVFYVFEPLYSSQKILDGEIKQLYMNRRNSPRHHLFRETLENFLTCNVKDVDLFTLRQHHMKNSMKTEPYYDCVMKKNGVLGILDCLPLLENPCRKSRVSCVKIIRFNMAEMSYLMNKHPGLKILHLIRDPRPTLWSQMGTGNFKSTDLNVSAAQFCTQVEKNLQSSVEMKKKYPGRIANLRFEDLAGDPDNMLEQIYSFLGLDLTASIREYVHNITTAPQPKCGLLCTRRNSTIIISQWREKVSFGYATKIDSICKTVYEKVGYLPVRDKASLKNLTIPSFEAPPEEVIFRSS